MATLDAHFAHNRRFAPRHENAMKTLRKLLLPLVSVIGLAMVVWGGFMPDYWMLQHLPPGIEPDYPQQAVLTFCAIVLAECGLLLAVLRPASYCRSWGRALCASVLALALAGLWFSALLHAPPYYGMHLQWWLLVSFGLVLLTLYSAGQAWRQRRKVDE
jgi:peptidoglycan/LPS O-acetylase OafA/YrhL